MVLRARARARGQGTRILAARAARRGAAQHSPTIGHKSAHIPETFGTDSPCPRT
ncbi:hypothetical protein BURPS1710A_A0076 [Burkholderia pseudomallei 1710a]|uniref:Uncharacterized protein n=1 Tax=Burkholderia pseudomallei 1710a TaxID=320371 RepID=A0A0E1VT52_BURPE|nr:hypothetical protein BUC_5110 [Burkholderia pseudomallei 576]EET04100.1 hypothetical protein BURPS1710A_A0076 [Burkholderia pseudomallei 1710a]